ncbi:MAG: DMT family transporter [Fimbriimonas sp.]
MLHTLILVAGVAAVGSAALMARVGLESGLTPLALSMWRLTAAVGVLALYRFLRRTPAKRLTRDQAFRLIGAGACLSIHFAAWFTSLQYLSVAHSTLLVSTTPLWAGLVGLAIPSQRPSGRFWVGLAIALGGMFLVTANDAPSKALASPAWIGDAMALLGAAIFVPSLLLSQRVQKEVGTEQAIAWIYGSAAVCLWVFTATRGQAFVPTAPAAWGSIFGMAIVAQLGGHTIFNWALRHFSAGQVSAAMLMEPVFAGVLAWILLGEKIGPWQALGGVVLLVGVGMALAKAAGETTAPEVDL